MNILNSGSRLNLGGRMVKSDQRSSVKNGAAPNSEPVEKQNGKIFGMTTLVIAWCLKACKVKFLQDTVRILNTEVSGCFCKLGILTKNTSSHIKDKTRSYIGLHFCFLLFYKIILTWFIIILNIFQFYHRQTDRRGEGEGEGKWERKPTGPRHEPWWSMWEPSMVNHHASCRPWSPFHQWKLHVVILIFMCLLTIEMETLIWWFIPFKFLLIIFSDLESIFIHVIYAFHSSKVTISPSLEMRRWAF